MEAGSTMTKVWRVLTRNLAWKLLSVLLAVMLWIAVEGEPELVTVQSVPVFYRNVEPTLALVSNPPVTVKLELRGPSDVLGRDNLSNVSLELDLAGQTEPGEKVFPVSRANVTLPTGVNFVRSEPSEVKLHLDRAPADRALEPKGNSAPKQ
jgi:YbbR domain-containing protein